MSSTLQVVPADAASERDGREQATEVEFRHWPLRDAAPLASLALIALLCAAATGVGWLLNSPLAGAAALAAGVVTVWTLWLPTTTGIGPAGIRQRVLGRQRGLAWGQIQQYQVRQRGVLLHRTPSLAPIAAFRAWYLPFGPHREQILSALDRHWAAIERQSPPAAAAAVAAVAVSDAGSNSDHEASDTEFELGPR